MAPITEENQTIRALSARVEEVEGERDVLLVAIAEHVEAIGGEGNNATALADSLGQLERLLNGRDVDAGLSLEGVAGQVEALVWLFRNATTCDDMEKAERYFARLDFSDAAASCPVMHVSPPLLTDAEYVGMRKEHARLTEGDPEK